MKPRLIILAIVILLKLVNSNSYGQIYEGVATYFDGIATPFGGCGIPENALETDNYVALNVYHSPGLGTMWTRPINGAAMAYIGEYNNGNNCGRWLNVTIGENCLNSSNEGALGRPFCEGGQWVNDQYSGASLPMIVTDACGDNNGWCRDSRYHLDIHRTSLNRFVKNGQPINTMFPLNWNNRKIYWEYIKAPNYSGDIKIYFLNNAQYYWPCIAINHLENGIHEVEQRINGLWVKLARNSDMGQSFILQPGTEFRIRIKDADDEYINNYREYIFTFPPSCVGPCLPAATEVTYTVYNPTALTLEENNDIGIKPQKEAVSFWWPKEWGDNPRLRLIDLAGRELSVTSTMEASIDGAWYKLSSIPEGTYLYTISTNTKISSGKLIVYQ